MADDEWIAVVEQTAETARQALLSRAQINEAVDSLCLHRASPYTAICLQVPRDDEEPISIGTPGEGQASTRTPVLLSSGTITVDCWAKPNADHDDRFPPILAAIANIWFAPERRTNERSRLIVKDTPGTIVAASLSASAFRAKSGAVSLLFADVDHLKQLNAALGQNDVDSKILTPLARLLDANLSDDCVLIHRSGDEFLVLCPGGGARALSEAYRLQRAVRNWPFEVEQRIDLSIGIASADGSEGRVELNDLESRAEEALKPPAVGADSGDGQDERDKHRRGRTSILPAARGQGADIPASPEFATALVKASVNVAAPFGSSWLNLISSELVDEFRARAETGQLATLVEPVAGLMEWIKPTWSDDPSDLTWIAGQDTSSGPCLSSASVAMAAAHALLRSVFLDGPAVFGITEDTVLAVEFGTAGQFALNWGAARLGETIPDASVIDLGGFVTRVAGAAPEDVEPRRALLVRIGHRRRPADAHLFADIVLADDRPSVGGALPDFWEASLARVATRTLELPDLATVAVVGDPEHATQILERLMNAGNWGAASDELARRTGLSETALRRAGERLDGIVHAFEDYSDAIHHVSQIMRDAAELNIRPQPETERYTTSGLLNVRADLAPFALPPSAGCRVRTAAQAFPVVLELLKNADADPTVTDQSGAPMIDLIDFKLQIARPHEDQIPDFYQSDEAELLSYFNRAFLAEDGIFYRPLAPQLPRFIAHLANAIVGAQPFSTRRAILIVPVPDDTEYESEHELGPLGLVSIRAIPRLVNRLWRIHFSYTWRTVEALVGLPYSVFGSLRFSEYLVDRLREALPADVKVSLAEVSYVAHSLHMTDDVYARRVARQIIQLASR